MVWDDNYKKVVSCIEMSGRWPKEQSLIMWVSKQRDKYISGLLSDSQVERLSEINMDWMLKRNKNKVLMMLIGSAKNNPNREPGAGFYQRALEAGFEAGFLQEKLSSIDDGEETNNDDNNDGEDANSNGDNRPYTATRSRRRNQRRNQA